MRQMILEFLKEKKVEDFTPNITLFEDNGDKVIDEWQILPKIAKIIIKFTQEDTIQLTNQPLIKLCTEAQRGKIIALKVEDLL